VGSSAGLVAVLGWIGCQPSVHARVVATALKGQGEAMW